MRPISGHQRPNGLTIVATSHILMGVILVCVWVYFIQQLRQGYIQPSARSTLTTLLTLAPLILILTGLGVLRLKKWALITAFILTPIMYTLFSFIVIMPLAGFPLAGLISLLIFITTIIFELVYIRWQTIQGWSVSKVKVMTQGNMASQEFVLGILSNIKGSRVEILGIVICLLLLFLFWFLKI